MGDFKGQLHCERTFQILVVIFGLIGFVAGYIQQEFRITFLFLATGGGISAVICLRDWPWWNRNPLEWLPEPEQEEEIDKKKKKKKDKVAVGEKEAKDTKKKEKQKDKTS